MRTAAEGSTTEDLRADIQFLQKLWTSIMDTIGNVEPEQLIYEDLLLPLRLLRDLLGSGIERVRVDSEIMFNKVKDFADCQ